MKSNSKNTITKIMTLEEMNRKLNKVLDDLNNAIEDRDLVKVEEAMKKIKETNKKTEGQANDAILTILDERIAEIVKDIKSTTDIDEKKDLVDIKAKIRAGKDPFEKTKAVVESLSKKGVNQDDLKMYKEQQKNDNTTQIDAIKANNQELAVGIADIEMRYIDKIEPNDEAIKILDEIKNQKDYLVKLVNPEDVEEKRATESIIKTKISELSSKGVNVSAIQNFESNPSVIDGFVTSEKSGLEAKSDAIATGIATDTTIPAKMINQYGLNGISNAKDLKAKYKEMVGTRQKNVSKIATLEAENRQIDKTIKTLNKEEEIKNIAYDEKGNVKSSSEIARAVLSNDIQRQKIEERVNNKFDSKNPFKRFGARMNYYQEMDEDMGKFKAFWKAFTSSTKSVKRIATNSAAVKTGIGMATMADNSMKKRQNDFKATIKKQAAKEMSENPDLTENDIKDNAIEEAYKSAFRDDDGR